MTDFRQQLAREGWKSTVCTIAKPKGSINANQARKDIRHEAGQNREDSDRRETTDQSSRESGTGESQ